MRINNSLLALCFCFSLIPSYLYGENTTLILPFVGRTAGVGIYYGPVLSISNVGSESINIVGGKVLGRMDGEGAVITGIPLLTNTLEFGFGFANLNQLYFDTSYTRGMDDDEKVTQTTKGQGAAGFLNWYFFDKQLRISNVSASWKVQFDKYFNSDEEEIELPGIHLGDLKTNFFLNSLIADFTDDIDNPSSGLKLGASYDIARTSTEYSGTDTFSYFANGYLPLGDNTTWVFRGFRSEATVKQQASTDKDVITSKLNINCDSLTDTGKKNACEDLKNSLVDYLSSHNEFGTATPLGGSRMLRSFREARFRGKHSVFAGTELRWKVPDFIGKSQLQMALFSEIGSVDDSAQNLGVEKKASYGIAFRIIIEQLTLRLEAATGDNSQEWHLIVGESW